jgi:hypothetical protein
MLFQSVTADVIPQGQGHYGVDKLQPAIADIHDDQISAFVICSFDHRSSARDIWAAIAIACRWGGAVGTCRSSCFSA